MSASKRAMPPTLLPLLLASLLLSTTVHGAFVNFANCLDQGIVKSKPLILQWIPLFVDARFDASHPSHNLEVTIYGNVSGQQVVGTYPPADSPQWSNPNITFGKISAVGSAGNYSTLFADFRVLTYDAYNARATQFCPALINGTCPLGPYFTANASNPYDLPAFRVAHDFGSSYAFSTLSGTMRVVSGDQGAPQLACVSASITPDLGPRIGGLLTWLPAVVLIIKGIATLSAAIWSPWGSTDIFRWSSNYGRDEDLLRLVTPGFGDCLQYIQFVTLTGALSLQYPGFYQPAVSQTGWSLLLFNQSFVSHGSGYQSLVDGIYSYNGTYGMTAMSQLIGMSEVEDIWACMAIWLLVIAVAVILLCQLGFFARWIYRATTKTSEEDLRQKNIPFTLGNMIRLLFSYFILPIVALSLFQLVIAPNSPAVVVAMAVVLFVIMIVVGGLALRVIFSTKPRTILFDDMPTVLLYGPLYNTYSDSAAPFALVPVAITFMRGVALGAIQPSGIAQIIVLAICEVILILTLNGFRPFQGQTSMNAYHTAFAVVRLVTVLLSIAFVPPLAVGEATKGWIGYVILLLHACVLVFGFFLNAAQTLIEVIARSLGVAGDAQHGAIRGSILNIRMLKKRQDRPRPGGRSSMTSNAAILRDSEGDPNGAWTGGRSRSISANSQQLLNRVKSTGGSTSHRVSAPEDYVGPGDPLSSPGVDAEHAQSGFSYLPANGIGKGGQAEEETYYRPPRPRKQTMDTLPPGSRATKSITSGDFPYQDSPEPTPTHLRQAPVEFGFPGRESPAPAYIRDRSDSNENGPRPDYAVREVDQYYRGPALSDQPTRKLKTGPADPEGPAANASSWFQRRLFGAKQGKKKEPSKGFEVVRSARMQPGMQRGGPEDVELQTSPTMHQEPYQDSPPLVQESAQAGAGAERRSASPSDPEHVTPTDDFNFGFDGSKDGSVAYSSPYVLSPVQTTFRPSQDTANSTRPPGLRGTQLRDKSFDTQRAPRPSADTDGSRYDRPSSEYGDEVNAPLRYSTQAPSLRPIEPVGSIDLPSRFNSRRSVALDGSNNPPDGQQWLRDVNNLSWPHGSQRPLSPLRSQEILQTPTSPQSPLVQSPTAQQFPSSALTHSTSNRPQPRPKISGTNLRATAAPPTVPQRSSRRSSSQDYSAGAALAPPLSPEQAHADVFAGFDSGETSPDFNTRLDFLTAPLRSADGEAEERPGSYTSVNRHRAADSITRNSFGANAAMQGTRAEFLRGTPEGEGGFL